MTLYTEQELVSLRRDEESQLVERKRRGGLNGKVIPENIGSCASNYYLGKTPGSAGGLAKFDSSGNMVHARLGLVFGSNRLRSGPFEGPAIVKPPTLPGDTYWDPLLAEIMHHLGFAQRVGIGVPLARKALADNGNPPLEFAFTATHVAVAVRPAP